MKKALAHLPKHKRDELKLVAEIVQDGEMKVSDANGTKLSDQSIEDPAFPRPKSQPFPRQP